MSTDVRKLPPVNRKPRPVRRDHGDYIRALAFDELALKAVLIKTGVPTSHINQAVYDINEAVSYHGSQSRPAQVLKDAHEREDLQELQARITYVLDSLHALSNESRERILSLAIPYSKEADPHYIECSLRKLDYRVRGVLHVMPTEGILAGKPAYNNTRNTPLLASLAGVWFQAFPDDAGVRRDGQYAEKGTAEYHGELQLCRRNNQLLQCYRHGFTTHDRPATHAKVQAKGCASQAFTISHQSQVSSGKEAQRHLILSYGWSFIRGFIRE